MLKTNDIKINTPYRVRYLYVAWVHSDVIDEWDKKLYVRKYRSFTYMNVSYIDSDYIITDTLDIVLTHGKLSVL
jgi:hypothetical protein